MTGADESWWRKRRPEAEDVLRFGTPRREHVLGHVGWACRLLITCLGLAWLAVMWLAETMRDSRKLISNSAVLAYVMWLDRFIRSQRVCAVATRQTWWLKEMFKPRRISIDNTLKYHRNDQNVVFSRRLFLVFEYLSDPDAALVALNSAREASA